MTLALRSIRKAPLGAILPCAVLAASFATSTPAIAATCSGVKVTASTLNVRSGPGTGYSIVGSVNSGETYVTTSSSGDWKKIWFNNHARWLHAGYTSSASLNCGTVTADTLNVRSGPGTGYGIVGTSPKGSKWSVIGSSGDWRKIWYASEARWVHGTYLNQNATTPSIGLSGVTINGGAASTSSRYVKVSFNFSTSTPSHYRISHSSTFSGASWKSYTGKTVDFTLSTGGGTKRVYMQLKNSHGRLSNTVSDTITYNPTSTASGYRIDRTKFFNRFAYYYGTPSTSQRNGINYLIDNMEQDKRPAINNQTVWMRQIAYVWATTKHEVANTYQPITEYSNTHCVNYSGGCKYKGRGYVQLTHDYNYKKMSPIVGVDLFKYPERALEPRIAYVVMSHGMHYGMFTGRKLGDYVYSGKTDYWNARRVVNGTDRASLIEGYAKQFQNIMEQSTQKL
ncbi:SH3 domain-containing protein [Marilutibacter alkalisoli]|uniref:SH3 domain-containing protein n=1 Tax=Marilutibacter alkalisoli TaxID=2591633 RepID=A0A514BSB7_9GAMM|nr:SH3 domain-containing protein [Lysobacter alkalisoli]QDH70276.1 SH3 domain-containing protein [Lysobacter alkalisoli]